MNFLGRLFSNNALLTMVWLGILVMGALSIPEIKKQLWPDFEPQYAYASMEWPGASIPAVDSELASRMDGAISGLDGVSDVVSFANEEQAFTRFRVDNIADVSSKVFEAEQAIRSLTDLPKGVLPPLVRVFENLDSVARLNVVGPFDTTAAVELAELVRSKLNERGLSQTRISAPRPPEFTIEIDRQKLSAFGLEFSDVSAVLERHFGAQPRFRAPDNEGGVIRIQNDRTGAPVREIERLAVLELRRDPVLVRLSDVASINRSIDDTGVQPAFRAGNGFFVRVFRAPDSDLFETYALLREAVAELEAELPEAVEISIFDIEAAELEGRVAILFENALVGIALVIVMLALFVGFRAALWVSVGIVTTYALAFCIMYVTGQSINFVSVFAMLMVIGIIVDDSIVVAERIEANELHMPRLEAATLAVAQTWQPVLIATLTTIAGFATLLMLTDSIGDYVAAIPLFVTSALIASYFECFVILPHHMARHGKRPKKQITKKLAERLTRQAGMVIGWSTRHAMLSVLLSVGVIAGGVTAVYKSNMAGFQFWPNPETRTILAYITLPSLGSRPELDSALGDVWAALDKTVAQYENDPVAVSFGIYGQHFLNRQSEDAPALGTMLVELARADGTGPSLRAFTEAFRANIDAQNINALIELGQPNVGLTGADFEVMVEHDDLDTLRQVILDLRGALGELPEVETITDTITTRTQEEIFAPNAFSNFTAFGAERLEARLVEILRGVDGVSQSGGQARRWRLTYAPDDGTGLELLRTEDGNPVLIEDLVSVDSTSGVSRTERRNGRIAATLTADLGENEAAAAQVHKLMQTHMDAAEARYGVTIRLGGKAAVQDETLQEIAIATALSLFLMFVVLAVSMRSYAKPFIALALLPVGIAVGLIGHAVLSFSVTLLSLVAFVGLAGILINDTVLLIDALERRLQQGEALREAIVEAYKERLRPIFLTSTTTVVGLLPLLSESRAEAQFLIPIAVSIVFGLVGATLASFFLFPPLCLAIYRDRRPKTTTSTVTKAPA